MCVGDWRFGRLIRSQQTAFDTAAGTGLVYPANNNRVGIFIAAQNPAASVVASVVVTVDGKFFCLMTAGSNIGLFTLETVGDLVTKRWVISQATVAATGGTTEWFLPEEVLQAGIEEFKRDYPGLIR